MCTPPKMTSRGCRGNTSRNTLTGPAAGLERGGGAGLSPERGQRGVAHRVRRQVPAPSVPSTRPSSRIRSDAPVSGPSSTVATTSPPAPRAAARTSGRTARLDEHLDRPAAGEPDLPRALVGHAEGDELGRAAADGLADLGGGGAFHAAAGDRARHRAVGGGEHGGAFGPGRRAPDAGHHRAPDGAAFGGEAVVVGQQVTHGVLRVRWTDVTRAGRACASRRVDDARVAGRV